MKQNLKNILGIIAVLLLVISVGINNPANAAVSSFQQTCNNINISGNAISANCRRIDGSFTQSSLILKGIENIDGTLEVTNPSNVSNYQLSCNKIGINGDVISALCKRRNGSTNLTSLALNGIENINGVLKYTSAP